MKISFLQQVVLGLLLCLICMHMIGVVDLEGGALWFLSSLESLIGNLFGMATKDDQIAMDSTQALSCAIDTTAKWNGEDSAAINSMNNDLIFASRSCSKGAPVGMAIARYAPKHGMTIARILGALEGSRGSITGAAIIPPAPGGNLCGTSECGLTEATYSTCAEDQRCLWDNFPIPGWWCKKDPTCDSPYDRATINKAPEAYARCFGGSNHVCVICGQQNYAAKYFVQQDYQCTVIDKKRCGIDNKLYKCTGVIEPKWNEIDNCPNGCEYGACRAAGPIPFKCQVVGFELPQNFEIGDGFFSNVIEYAATWIGAVGEPRYLVYYETFPEGIESEWIYDTTDQIMVAVAIGGIMNIGGGTLKAGWAGSKAGLSVVRRAGIRSGLRRAIKEGGDAASERLAFEYGGKAAVSKMVAEKIIKRKAGGAVIGNDGVRVVLDDQFARRIISEGSPEMNNIFYDINRMDHYGALTDYSLAIRSGRNIEAESVDRIAKHWDLGLDEGKIISLTDDLNLQRVMHENGNFLDNAAETQITNAIKRVLVDSTVLKDTTKKSFLKVFLEADGKIAKTKALLNKKALMEGQQNIYDDKVDDLAVDIYQDIVTSSAMLPGSAASPTTARGTLVKFYNDAWVDARSATGVTDKSRAYADEIINKRAVPLLEGVPFGHGGITSIDKRKIIMMAALAGAYLAMETDARLEKYDTCGGGGLCLHYPKLFGDDNNREYELDKDDKDGSVRTVSDDYKGLVVSDYPGDETDRFHIISPCKTDLVIEGHEKTEGFCRCEELYGADKIYYKFDKRICALDINGDGTITGDDGYHLLAVDILYFYVYTNPDGTCPGHVIPTINYPASITSGERYNVITVIENLDYITDANNNLPSTDPVDYGGKGGHFECEQEYGESVDDALERCVDEKVHKPACTDMDGDLIDDCLIDPYRECDGSLASLYLCDNTVGTLPPWVTSCAFLVEDSSIYKNDDGTNAWQNPDYVVHPLNVKENVASGEYESELITVCKDSWLFDFFGTADPLTQYMPCVSVGYDERSMQGYSKSGFSHNYCGENKADFKDSLSTVCFWGGMGAAIGVTVLSGGVAGTVVLPVMIGSGSVACEKLIQRSERWPHSQY